MATLPKLNLSSAKNELNSLYGTQSSNDMKALVTGIVIDSSFGTYDSDRGGVSSNFKDNLRFTEILDDNSSIMKEICNVLKESLDFDKESELNRKNSELKKSTNPLPVKTPKLDKKDKKEEKKEKPFEERAAKFLKTGNFFTDLKNLGIRAVKDELLELTDIGSDRFKLEDYITPLKKFREFLDPRRKSEIERDKRVDLREDIDELETLSKDDAASKEEKDKFLSLIQQKRGELGESEQKSEELGEIEQQQLDNLDKLVEYQDEQQKLQRDSLKLQQEKSIDDEKLRVKQEELLEKQLEWPENLKAIAELLKDLKKAIEECCLNKCEGEGKGTGGGGIIPFTGNGDDGKGKGKGRGKGRGGKPPRLTPGRRRVRVKPRNIPKPTGFAGVKETLQNIKGKTKDAITGAAQKSKDVIKKIPKGLGKLGVLGATLFAGYDFYDRKSQDQTTTQALAGTGSSILGGIGGAFAGGKAGAALGAKLGVAGGPLGVAIGTGLGLLGGAILSTVASGISDRLTGVGEESPNILEKSNNIDKNGLNSSIKNAVSNSDNSKILNDYTIRENEQSNIKNPNKNSTNIDASSVQQNNVGGSTTNININGSGDKTPPPLRQYNFGMSL